MSARTTSARWAFVSVKAGSSRRTTSAAWPRLRLSTTSLPCASGRVKALWASGFDRATADRGARSVGVVVDSRQYEPDAEPPITTYFPVAQYNITSRFLVARTTVDAETVTPAVLRIIRDIDSDLPPYDVRTMGDRLHDSFARRRLSMILLVTFAAVALVLAAIGTYGVISYWVEQRTREIGIRVALGAEPPQILGMVFREFGAVIGVAVVSGIAIAISLSRVMRGLVFGVGTIDPLTFVFVTSFLGLVAMAATWLPARQALAVEPITAIRSE